ncbi:MBL fold metallo-hydrolase [Rhizobium lusitanum]|uniref:MBL fold metallo-hydrolase n=1 Tax=Rhizobium lusitanum TaxID=293958 RepID=A0A6L9UB97_9HYPH|nr:N-acyl homoserine lactonase family protein [Rhizobium lusitanum]NEI72561.1 MBL fold metallo-hydrolase [Rhizobium lusitanum]
MPTEQYEVFAILYAKSIRHSKGFFLDEDPHNGPAQINYYIWVIRNDSRIIVVDTGFDAARAVTRSRDFIRSPMEGLASLGIDAADVGTVILTHLHYDHAGNIDEFPRAEFVLQDEEMRFATGRSMRFKPLRAPFELTDILSMVTRSHEGRIRFVTGTEEIAPGVTVHHVPGHTKGLQAVTVETSRGRLCLASDAAHFYANIALQSPFPIVADVSAVLEGHERISRLAGSLDRLIPGHDPLVMEHFPQWANDPLIRELSGAPLRLDGTDT